MQNLQPFKLERYFALHEFSAPYLLSASDCESLDLAELLALATPQGLELWNAINLGYTESAGHPLLREAIAALYTGLSPDQVLVLVPEEGIFIAMHSLLSPGDQVVYISPAYQSLSEVARSVGCRMIPWQLKVDANSWQLDLNLLEDLLNEDTRLLVLNFPHNPTGCLPSFSELSSIIDLARSKNIIVFSDEMYRMLEYDQKQRLPAVCDLYERGISLSGMSKSLAMPGLRIGWLATSDVEWRERWITFKDYTTICSSAPSEVLAWIGLSARESILSRNLKIIWDNLVHASQFFSRYDALFGWSPPQAGSVAFPEWRGPGTVDELSLSLVNSQGVMLVPGSLFDYPAPHFRLGLGRRNFQEALERVELFLQKGRADR
jgi:aspartate/methionine/tyrosine aminotransferase